MSDTKDFYFKFFAREYLTSGDVRELPLEAQGILPRLWCVCCLDGSIPLDLEDLSIASGVKLTHLRTHMRTLLPFFYEGEDGRLYSRRMEKERATRIKVSAAASKAANIKQDRIKALKEAALVGADGSADAPANGSAVNSSELIVNTTTKEQSPSAPGSAAPPVSRKRKSATTKAKELGYSDEVIDFAMLLKEKWPKEHPKGGKVTLVMGDLLANLNRVVKDNPSIQLDLIGEGVDMYLATTPYAWKAPQHYFGPGGPGESPRWLDWVNAAFTKRKLEAQESVNV